MVDEKRIKEIADVINSFIRENEHQTFFEINQHLRRVIKGITFDEILSAEEIVCNIRSKNPVQLQGDCILYLGKKYKVMHPAEVYKILQSREFYLYGLKGIRGMNIYNVCPEQAKATGVILDIFNMMTYSYQYGTLECYGWMSMTRNEVEYIRRKNNPGGVFIDDSFSYLYPQRLDVLQVDTVDTHTC